MTKTEDYSKDPRLIATHYGEEYDQYYNAIVPPIFMNSLNVFNTIDEYYQSDRFDKHTYIYGRVSNPTVRILEDKIAALEHGVKAAVFSSGMAAATTAVLSICNAGDHIVCVKNAYPPLRIFLQEHCIKHLHMSVTFVKGNDVEEFENAVTDQTALIILESPSTLVFSIQDLEAVAKIAKKHNARTYIDNSYCTPLFQTPIDFGIDIVMHTASKYLGGHSDLIGGVLVSGDLELMKQLLDYRETFGGIIGPFEAWLIMRGIRTLDVRMQRHQEETMKVAEYLENHPKIKQVNYPGLKSHPQHELIEKQQKGSCGLLSFEINGSVEQAKKVVNSLKLFKIGVSWGGFESLVCMPALYNTDEMNEWLGTPRGIIRIHCGVEGADNLISDLETVLEQI